MGFEYRFRVSRQDMDHLGRNPDGITTLDTLLKSAPGFTGQVGSVYSFNDSSAERKRWPATALLDGDGFVLCLYERTPTSLDLALMNYLIHELIARSGHVEVEEA